MLYVYTCKNGFSYYLGHLGHNSRKSLDKMKGASSWGRRKATKMLDIIQESAIYYVGFVITLTLICSLKLF